MSSGNPLDERREQCDKCVKGDFATVKKLVFVILTACILSGGIGSYAAIAKNTKDGQQDAEIAVVKTQQVNILNNQEDQKILTRQLIALATKTNLLVQTHIARSN